MSETSRGDLGRPPDRSRHRAIAVGAIGLVALQAAGAFLPRGLWIDGFFGIESYRSLGGIALLVSAVPLVAITLRPGVADRAAAALGRIAGRVPGPARVPLVLAGLVAAFLGLTCVRLSGDAGSIVSLVAAERPYPSNPLVSFLQIGTMRALGTDAREAIRLVACASGLVYAWAALRIGKECFPDPARRAAVSGLLLSVGAVALFFGALEVYAPLAAGTLVYLHLGLRRLRGGSGPPLEPIVLGTTFCLHGSAGLLLPSLVLLANGGGIRPLRPGRWALWGVLFLIPLLLCSCALLLFVWDGTPPETGEELYGNFLGAGGQGPLLPLTKTTANLENRYAFLDLDHAVGVLNLYLLAAPVGFVLLFGGLRRALRDRPSLWVLSAAAPLLLFPWFWNVSYPLRRDWDLFSTMGIPLVLAAALAFLGGTRSRGVALSAVCLSCFCFVPLVIANLGSERERIGYAATVAESLEGVAEKSTGARRDRLVREAAAWREREAALTAPGVAALYERASEDFAGRRYVESEAAYRRILTTDPSSPLALSNLGGVLIALGRLDDAEEVLLRAARADPYDLHTRMNLSMIAERRGDRALAIRHLGKGVRGSFYLDPAASALRMLAVLMKRDGRSEDAALLLRMAKETE